MQCFKCQNRCVKNGFQNGINVHIVATNLLLSEAENLNG